MVEMASYQPGVPCWVDLMTSDPEGARAFYGELLGWSFDVGSAEYGHYTMCQVRGRNVAGMVGDPAPEGAPTAWSTYLASDDVERAAQRVAEAGGQVVMGPADVMDRGRMLVAIDPAGAAFGVWQAGEHLGAELVNEPGAVIWNELVTPDLARAEEFYAQVFGYAWEPADTGGGPTYHVFHVDGRAVGGALQTDAARERTPPHWMTYFAVTDPDAAVAAVRRLRGHVLAAPTDSAFGRFAVVADPQGATFTVVTPVAQR